jgi:hypothetical protein
MLPYTGRVLRNRHAERWLGREAELEARAEEVAHDYAEALPCGRDCGAHCMRTDPRHPTLARSK